MKKLLCFLVLACAYGHAQQNVSVDSFVPTVYRYHGVPPASISCLRYQIGFDDVANNIYTCSTAGVWTLTAGGGGSMTWPVGAGIAVYGGSNAWGTSLTAPAGTIVGTTDTQTLTNKNLNSGTNTFPIFNQNTTGTAAALTATPTNCGAGVAAIGILANGNATGCFTPTGSGTVASGTVNGMAYYTGSTTVGSTTPPSVNGLYFGVENVTASATVAPTHQLMGVPVVTPATPYTMLYSDRATYQRLTGGSTFTFNLGQITSNFASNMPFIIQNGNSGLLTLTANAADKIDNSATGGTSTLLANFAASVYQDSSSAPGNWWTVKFPTFAAFGTTCTNGLNWSTASGIGCLSAAPVKSGDAAGGDLSGTYPNPGVAKINGTAFAGTSGDVVSFGAANIPADSGFLATNVVRKDTTNSGAAAMTLDMSASTTVNALKIPVGAGLTSGANGAIAYDSTNNNTHTRTNAADSLVVAEAAAIAANTIPKATDATHSLQTASLLTDDGTTATYTGTGGAKAPVFTSTGSTAGFHDYPQGTTSAAVAPCNVATSICEQAPAAVTSYLVTKPGAAGTGVRIGVNSSNVITENFSSAFGAVSQTAKTAAVTTFTVCAATANTACGQVGQYRLTYNVWGSGTACSSVTAGSVVLNLTWTDENATAHTTINAPIWDQKTGAMTAGQVNFNTALGTEGGSGSMIISTNGTIIQAATTYTACTTGTGTYNVRITTEQLQ